jgi:aryl-alcohol dehydrogenase-like predicted oxidoreductase
MQMRRREFLARSIAGVSGVLLGGRLNLAQERKGASYNPYEWVALGKTKIKVTRVGLGTGMRGGNRQSNHTRMGQERFEALAKGCYERGIRLFDVADLYGTHPFLADALKKMPRKDYAIVSKIWWQGGGIPEKERPDADVVVQRFLKELNTDYIDLILLHCVSSPTWPERVSTYMDSLAKLKKKGVIRGHGVSCHGLEALQACVKEPWVDSVHARINPYAVQMDVRRVEEVPRVVEVLKALHEQGKAVVGMKIIGEGRFRDSDEQRDESIRFALNLGCVDAMVVGFEKVEEIDDFAARVRKVPVVINKPEQLSAYRLAEVA